MNRPTILILDLTLCVLVAQCTQVANGSNLDGKNEKAAMVTVLGTLKVTNQCLDLRYQLKNDSEHDIWVCEDVTVNYDWDLEVFMAEENRILVIRRRLDVPASVYWSTPPIGRYIRLRAGENRTESLSLSVPVHACHVFTSREPMYRKEYATSLVFEIGYYDKDLPRIVRNILEEAEKFSDPSPDQLVHIDHLGTELPFGILSMLKSFNKDLSDKSDQVTVPYSFQALKGELFSQITVEGLHIPFDELPPQLPEPVDVTKQTPLEVLRDLFYEGEIEADEYRAAEVLLNCGDHLYDETAHKIADVYKQVTKGIQPPGRLIYLLDKVADKRERDNIVKELRKKKAEEEHQKQTLIAELLTKAKNNDNVANGHKALTALDELLTLDPSHDEAFKLIRKISAYYRGEVKTNSIGMNLVRIPPGEFLMGTPYDQGGMAHERPVHKVRISKGFWMGVYEVTQVQYEGVMGKNPSNFKDNNLPVEQVSWDEAIEFCRKLSQLEGKSYRLPAEAEWEYTCRADTATRFSWGDTQQTGLCNAENDLGSKLDRNVDLFRSRGLPVDSTVQVGSFKANAFGLYDMHGNVREWCHDWYSNDYYKMSPQLDPPVPSKGSSRVNRGGSWRRDLYGSRSAYRYRNKPGTTMNDLGFRVVLELETK